MKNCYKNFAQKYFEKKCEVVFCKKYQNQGTFKLLLIK